MNGSYYESTCVCNGAYKTKLDLKLLVRTLHMTMLLEL